MKPVVLFDMDGTLTETRLPVEPDMMIALQRLSQHAHIGIVSGSDYDYIKQQMQFENYWHNDWVRDILVYPCNGTKRYIRGKQKFSVDMREELGDEKVYSLIELLLDWQMFYLKEAKIERFKTPLTGLHIQNRGLMINWCPIGRGATHEERALFQEFDESICWRDAALSALKAELEERGLDGITIVKGGSTSFDIYPDGWDKRFVLRFHEQEDVYFIGDRWEKGGNDYELYAKLKAHSKNKADIRKQLHLPWWKEPEIYRTDRDAFPTTGPQETIKIIEENMGSRFSEKG